MTEVIEFGTRDDANAVRDDHGTHLTGRFDRRFKRVVLADDVPDDVEAEVRGIAADGRADREAGAGHLELTDGEKRRLGPFSGDNNYRKATAVKAILTNADIEDWEAFYDPTLTVDEHRHSADQWRQQQAGADVRDAPDEAEQMGREADAAAAVEGEGCNHARGHCQNGDPGACEFLKDECGVSETEVSTLLDYGEAVPFDRLDGETKGALSRSWNGYKAAVRRLAGLLDDIEREFQHAEKAAASIRAIEQGISDVETDLFEALEGHHRTLLDLYARHDHRQHGQPGHGRDPTEGELASRAPGGLSIPDRPPEVDRQPTEPSSVGVWEHEAETRTFDGQEYTVHKWRNERDRMDGGTEMVVLSTDNSPERWTLNVGNLDDLEKKTIARGRDRDELLAQAVDWVESHPDGIPAGFFGNRAQFVDERHAEDSDAGLYQFAENDTDEASEAPSEEHRRAQNDGYLRSGSRGFDDDASAREGLGQYAATGGERTLDNYETDA